MGGGEGETGEKEEKCQEEGNKEIGIKRHSGCHEIRKPESGQMVGARI